MGNCRGELKTRPSIGSEKVNMMIKYAISWVVMVLIWQSQAMTANQAEALEALGRTELREPRSLPFPDEPEGKDMLPGIDHIIMLMLENHSFDNIIGMLGRGDGFQLNSTGYPCHSNPYINGTLQNAYHLPTTCQLNHTPSNGWTASHVAHNNGMNDGFVRAPIVVNSTILVGGIAMGYYTEEDLPFTYSLANQFPIGDRFFCSGLFQTHSNRRYLIGGTSLGLTDAITVFNVEVLFKGGAPQYGTIFNSMTKNNITWTGYVENYPIGSTPMLFPLNYTFEESRNQLSFDQFYKDATDGTLPQFSFLDPNYDIQSQENPQNVVNGEALLADIIEALGASPLWNKTMLILNYDEHGGYYDHVSPPVALAPDDIPPVILPGEHPYDEFRRFGFRVPSIVVSPYAKKNYVSHIIYDHTSVLATLQYKWNLPSLTYRDANANHLFDFLDLDALRERTPTFPTMPKLAAPGNTTERLRCSSTGPGIIPIPGSVGTFEQCKNETINYDQKSLVQSMSNSLTSYIASTKSAAKSEQISTPITADAIKNFDPNVRFGTMFTSLKLFIHIVVIVLMFIIISKVARFH